MGWAAGRVGWCSLLAEEPCLWQPRTLCTESRSSEERRSCSVELRHHFVAKTLQPVQRISASRHDHRARVPRRPRHGAGRRRALSRGRCRCWVRACDSARPSARPTCWLSCVRSLDLLSAQCLSTVQAVIEAMHPSCLARRAPRHAGAARLHHPRVGWAGARRDDGAAARDALQPQGAHV